MTPAEKLAAAATSIDKRRGSCCCKGCNERVALANVLRSAVIIERSNRMGQKRPDRLLKSLLHLADLILAGESS